VATSTSGLTVSFASTTPSVCSVSGATLTLAGVGTCTVAASQAGNSTFAAAVPVSNSFSVAAAPLTAQTITFNSPGDQTVGVPASLVATASSGLTVAFASTTLGVCTVSGTALTLVSAGSCTVNASQAGNGTFAAAAVVPRTFTVAAALGAELVANGGFESAPAAAGQFALGWRGVNGKPATLSNDARSGAHSASLAVPDPGFSGSGLAGNSVDDGGLPSALGLYVGKTTVLTFWAKGSQSETGNVNFSLRYLDSIGNILNPVVNTSFGSLINVTTWTKITLNGPAIPANTSAIFVEMTLAAGPTGVTTDPDNIVRDKGQAKVLIDDLSVRVVP
jgi:ribosomal protein S11